MPSKRKLTEFPSQAGTPQRCWGWSRSQAPSSCRFRKGFRRSRQKFWLGQSKVSCYHKWAVEEGTSPGVLLPLSNGSSALRPNPSTPGRVPSWNKLAEGESSHRQRRSDARFRKSGLRRSPFLSGKSPRPWRAPGAMRRWDSEEGRTGGQRRLL